MFLRSQFVIRHFGKHGNLISTARTAAAVLPVWQQCAFARQGVEEEMAFVAESYD